MPLLTPNHSILHGLAYPPTSFKTHGCPESKTSTTMFYECAVKPNSRRHERYIMKRNVRLLYRITNIINMYAFNPYGMQCSTLANYGMQCSTLANYGMQCSTLANYGMQCSTLANYGMQCSTLANYGMQCSTLANYGMQYSTLANYCMQCSTLANYGMQCSTLANYGMQCSTLANSIENKQYLVTISY